MWKICFFSPPKKDASCIQYRARFAFATLDNPSFVSCSDINTPGVLNVLHCNINRVQKQNGHGTIPSYITFPPSNHVTLIIADGHMAKCALTLTFVRLSKLYQ